MSESIYLSIVIPCRNQVKMLKKTLTDIQNYNFGFEYEVIYVDSSSNDGSTELAKTYEGKIKNLTVLNTGRGKGRAVKLGMKKAKGEFRMFMDADSATPIKDIEKLMPYLKKGYDVVMGSRYTDKPLPATNNTLKALTKATKDVIDVLIYGSSKSYTATKKQGRLRQLISRGGNLAFVVLLGQSFADTRCGFKAYSKRAAETMFSLQRLPGFGFDTEILVIAKKHDFKIIEVPVSWIDDAEESNITLGNALKTFGEIFKIKWYKLSGKYSGAK